MKTHIEIKVLVLLLTFLATMTIASDASDEAVLQPPAQLETTNVPSVPYSLADRLAKFQNVRTASLVNWVGEHLLISTRFGATSQLHLVKQPLGMREQLTFSMEPIGGALVPPLQNPEHMVYAKDIGGNENYQLFLMDISTRESTLITDGSSRYTGVSFSPTGQRLAYSSNEINGRDSDLFTHHLDGTRDVIQQGEGIGWSIDDWAPDESRLLISRYISVVESELYEIDLVTKTRTRLLESQGAISIGTVAYDQTGTKTYFVSFLDGNHRRVYELDLGTGEVTPISPSIPWDVSFFRLSHDGSQMVIVNNEAGYSALHLYDLENIDGAQPINVPKGIVSGIRFSIDDSRLALNMQTTLSQSDVYVIDLEDQASTRWTSSEMGELNLDSSEPEELLSFTTFDKREIPVFLFRPEGEGPHPSLIFIHGGPESQYRPSFSSTFRFYLQELGLALWVPNVRGSAGYGKEFLGLDNGMLREDSVRDIGSLIKFIHQQPDMDSERIGVIGGSYGGYMVLASLVTYGDLIKAGVETVGISNFVTFLENTQTYRRDLRRAEYGDERDPEMRAFLESIAPLNHVTSIKSPLLIGQGLNDPRVPASESKQILDALQTQEVPVWYVLAHDEGHGFRKKPNRDYWQYVVCMFLQKYLIE